MLTRHLKWEAWWPLAAVLAGLFLVGAGACAQEQSETAALEQDTIPTVVMDALSARFPGAEIREWTKEQEDEVLLYDIEFLQEGRKCEADISESGVYINFEQEVAQADLPEAVKQAVEQVYPEASLREIMEITEVRGQEEVLEGYEVVLETADNREVEVTVAPDGRILEESEDDEPGE
jgi:hypothetical protein